MKKTNKIGRCHTKSSSLIHDLRIDDIKIGPRYRREIGDLRTLAHSIKEEGLLHPIGVTEEFDLVFGLRRLKAARDKLKWTTIPARIVQVSSIIAGEYAENVIRKDYTASERVAIACAIERQIGNRRGQRTDLKHREQIPDVIRGRRSREIAAQRAGFGNDRTYRQARRVVNEGTPSLIRAMDEDRVSISAAAMLVDADADRQSTILNLDRRAVFQLINSTARVSSFSIS